MRILVVSSFLPYPLYSGGHVRLFNLIKELSKSHKVTLVCEKRDYQTQKDIDEVKKICEAVYTVDRKKQWAPSNIIKTAVSPLPFLLVGHELPLMKKKIVDVLKNKQFDVIHVETFYVHQNLPQTYLPVVLAEHNIEYEVYERFMKKAPILAQPFLSVDIQKIKYWETKVWKEVKKLVAVSEEDKKKMHREDVVVVPNGVDLDAFLYKKKTGERKGKTILFMGDFKWIQNTDAAKFILKEIWPLVVKEKKKEQKVTLWIVGKHIPDSIKKMASEHVVIDENAPDKTADIYKRADILLAPIQVGGGTSYKIIEAMASGVPVVTTPLGVRGLGAKPGTDALVADTPEQLAKHVLKLLEDQGIYERIRKNAREFIEQKFSWKIIAKTLEEVYKGAIQENE